MITSPEQTRKLRYALLKNIIASNWQGVVDTSSALEEMKETKLYLEEFGTWEEFCQSVLHHTPQHVNRVLKSAYVTKQLTEESEPTGSLLKNERQARAISEVPPEKRKEVMDKAVSNGTVTAKSISQAAKSMKADSNEVLDKTDFVIPSASPAMETWNRMAEAQEMLTGLSQIKIRLTRALEARDKMYCEVNFSAAIADLTSSYQLLKVCLPYAVCPTCQGRVLNECATCKSRGMVSEFYWKYKVPDETRKIREKAVALRGAKK